MRRRDFLAGVGGAAAAWPLAAHAQQPAVPLIGFLNFGFPETSGHLAAAFRRGLNEAGYIEGQNVQIDYRWAHDDNDRMKGLAADLVRQRVSVIAITNGGIVARAAKAATSTIPIVFGSAGDPVAQGLVSSLNRPGENLTGITNMAAELGAKRLGLLHELLPSATRFAVFVNPTIGSKERDDYIADLRNAASTLGAQVEILMTDSSRDIDVAFATMKKRRTDALLLMPHPLFNNRRVQLVTQAAHNSLPVMYYDRTYCEAGGLMSYGASLTDQARQVGVYTSRILKGEKPADMPVSRASKFEFVINLQLARTIGIDVPATLLAQADAAIE